MREGKIDGAIAVVKGMPGSADKYRMMVRILTARRSAADIEQALQAISSWQKLDPSNPEPLQRLLEIRLFQGDLANAERALNQFSKRSPDLRATQYLKGLILQLDGKLTEAFQAYLQSVMAEEVGRSDGSRGAAAAQKVAAASMMIETAVGNYAGSAKLDKLSLLDGPDEQSQLKSSLLEWEECRGINNRRVPENETSKASQAWYNLGTTVLADYGRTGEALGYFDKAIECSPANELARRIRLFTLNYLPGLEEPEIFDQHRSEGKRLEMQVAIAGPKNGWHIGKNNRIRIAYLSSDFREHSVAFFLTPVLSHHDKEKFSVHLFHNNNKRDEYTAGLERHADSFHQVTALNDNQLRQLIVDQGIDILVDLNGLTNGNRLPVFAARAAPVQITWLGYPNTSGLTNMDFRIVDRITDPPDYAQSLCTEKLIYMPDIFSVYEPLMELPPVNTAPCLKTGMITFGSFNNLSKMNDELVGAWVNILERVPGSRLLLKNRSLTYSEPRRRLSDAFARHGLDPARLELMQGAPSRREHLACYDRVDISLDTFPYNGTTTNCESLVMGVPVVTLAGKAHRSRVSASQLAVIGMHNLVAGSWAEYIEIAAELAKDQQALSEMRQNLRKVVLESPLTDARSYTRNLESRFIEICKTGNAQLS